MPDLFFEDFVAGTALPEAEMVLDHEEAAFFAERFGPGAAGPEDRGSGPEPVSGFHVAALGMRMLFDAVVRHTASLGAPGVDVVTWSHPVRPGDRLRFTARVTAARLSASRPEMGLVTVAITIFNQTGTCVMTQENAIMVAQRPASLRDEAAEGSEEAGT